MHCGTQLRDEDRFCHRCGNPCEVKIPQPQQQPQHQSQTQYNFSEDWDRFIDELGSFIASRKDLEKEYNSICKKAKNQEYSNPNSAACYYYMAAVLCYVFYDDLNNQDSDRDWSVELGKTAIRSACRILNEDEEFKVMFLLFELIILKQNRQSAQNLSQELQSIKTECPHIESIEGSLIQTETLQDWFDKVYYEVPFEVLINQEAEKDLNLKAEFAKELINSSNQIDQEVGYANLADALFDMGSYKEAERYAIMGKDLYGNLSEYDHSKHLFWGICWCIYARCQEEAGDMDFAITLLDKGAALGIPWCKKEKERLQNEGYCENEEVDHNHDDVKDNTSGVQLASNEQEYLDALKESFEDGVISPRERKIIDRLRVSLGINEERAKELENLLQPSLPQK